SWIRHLREAHHGRRGHASPASSARCEPGRIAPSRTDDQRPTGSSGGNRRLDALQSDTGDYIGGGKQQVWTLKESDFSVGGNNRDIRASVSGQGDWWYLGISRSKQWPAWRRPVHQC